MLAPAKVNLYLHVLGKRDDGYHLLDSLIVFADIGDEISASQGPELSLAIDGPFADGLAADQTNLVLKAASALRELAGVRAGARIRLTKNLPLASGIGGGSSDAATTLQSLIRFWRCDLAPGQVHAIALSLGADVPVCLEPKPSFVGGIGGEIAMAGPLPSAWLLLANPLIATPTAAVFQKRGGPYSTDARWSRPPATFDGLLRHLEATRNDLTPAALEVTPVIADLLADLAALPQCALARLSGSGATCFGLFAEKRKALEAEQLLRRQRPGWWVRAAGIMA